MKEGKNNHSNELSNEDLGQVAGGNGELGEGWKNGFYDEELIKSYMDELKIPRKEAIDQLESDYLEVLKYGGWPPQNNG